MNGHEHAANHRLRITRTCPELNVRRICIGYECMPGCNRKRLFDGMWNVTGGPSSREELWGESLPLWVNPTRVWVSD